MPFDYTDNEINDIFEEAQSGHRQVTFEERGRLESNTSTVSSTIKTLGELFCEYYLCCPDEIQSLEEFLKTEKMDKFLTAANYQKLICGDAYLPSDALEYFRLKLPFDITSQKMHKLNTEVRIQNKHAEKLNLNMNDLLNDATQIRKEKIEERERRYHEYDVRYCLIHRDEINRKAREKYHQDEKHRAKVRADSKKRYDSLSPEAKEKMYEHQREKYASDVQYREYIHAKNSKRNQAERERMAKDPEYAALVRQKRRDAKRVWRLQQKQKDSLGA